MSTNAAASLINLLGFLTGIVLYVMLLWMVFSSRPGSNRLALLTGLFGFAWNAGGFGGYGLVSLGMKGPAPFVLAAAFGALCFLPAVVIDSALRSSNTLTSRWSVLVVGAGYVMSGIAIIIQFHSALTTGVAPSQLALRAVTFAFAALLAVLLVESRGRKDFGRVLWVVAMSIFAVSALHLSNHGSADDPWWLVLAGHHASLPLALLILFQDYRFALADIFLKRALAFMLLVAMAFGAFVFIVSPVLTSSLFPESSTAVIVAFSVLVALVYPLIRRGTEWFVDKIVLRRVDYAALTQQLSKRMDDCQDAGAVLNETIRILTPALNAEKIDWAESAETGSDLWLHQDRRSARVTVTTTEKPFYTLSISDLSAGRRLLSGDTTMLERAALLAARRIDAIRSMQERYRRDVEEQEVRKLAAEAELRALRAQINPHFLFNALTTIGYLIQTAPERALATLMRLSGLLRGVLRSGAEYVTIGEEIDLVEAYLDIERARFEERLRVRIDLPQELRRIRAPALIIQPLVENAIKHGISGSRSGGEVRITVRADGASLLVSITDTGAGASMAELEQRKARGLGLSNVEQRLKRYGAGASALRVTSAPGHGTTVEIRIPVPHEVSAAV
jgi:two-component system LytT family sensor kinase